MTKGSTYKFKHKNNKGKWVNYIAHGGSLQSYYTSGKGVQRKGYSFKDGVKIAVENASTASKLGKDILTGNWIGIASNSVTIIGKLRKQSDVYTTDGEQQLSNGLKLVYKAKVEEPIQLINPGDYFTTRFDTDPVHRGSFWSGSIINYFSVN